MREFRVLSLGAGVQSSALFLMACKGEIEPFDVAIFSDTQWEPPEVYDHLQWLVEVGERAGIPVHKVTKGNLRESTMTDFVGGTENKKNRYATMPVRVRHPDNTIGIIRRQCTDEYKIQPIEKFIKREVLGLKKRQRVPKDVRVYHYFGISLDEITRMRESKNHWQEFRYPLCGMPRPELPRAMTRHDCKMWLVKNYPEREVPRSACIGCPFRSNAEWRWIKSRPDLWADALEVDQAIRNAEGMDGQVFLHRDCVPLDEADLRDPEQTGQIEFGWEEECTGYCGM